MLNITLEVYLTFFSVIMMFFSARIVYTQYREYPDKALFLMFVAWISFALFQLLSAISYLLLNEMIFLSKNIFLVSLVLSAQATLNLMHNGKILNYRLIVLSFISAFDIAVLVFPNNSSVITFPNGDLSIANTGYNRILMALFFAYLMVIYFVYALKIYLNSPITIKREAKIFLIGNIIIGPVGLISFLSGLSGIIPGIVDIILGTGVLVSTIGLSKSPKLLYILPFKAIKLSAINFKTGMILYTYNWSSSISEITDELFASALLSINIFIRESIGQGNLTEIMMEGASMMIVTPTEQSVYYVVVATKPSYTLKIGLEKFAVEFFNEFSVQLKKNFIVDISKFDSATSFIPKCFPYIP